MSKYSRSRLRDMARTALYAKDSNDPRWRHLIMFHGFDPEYSEKEIRRLAR